MRYTVQVLGRGSKLLRNGHFETTAITALSEPSGRELAWRLSSLYRERCCEWSGAAQELERAGLEPAWLRRRALAAFDAAVAQQAEGEQLEPERELWWCESQARIIAEPLKGANPASIRAVREEFGLLMESFDQVLVSATFSEMGRRGGLVVVINDWLNDVEEETLRALLAAGNLYDAPDAGAQFELIEYYAEELAQLDNLSEHPDEVEVVFDRERLSAWARHHRPELLS